MKILVYIVLTVSVMAGCTSVSLDAYMDAPMKTVIKNEGAPTVVEYLDSETRAFIWRRKRVEDIPSSSIFVRQFSGLSPIFLDEESVRVRIDCEYILIGRRTDGVDENWSAWKVVGSIKPKFGC